MGLRARRSKERGPGLKPVAKAAGGSSGHLVPENDARAMATKTAEMLQNPELLKSMSIATRHRSLELSLENATDRLMGYLQNLIDRSQSHCV